MKQSRRILLSRATFSGLLLSLVPLTTSSTAAPKGAQVGQGSASFQQNGNVTNIRASNGAVINYTGFDIGKGETVNFIQPGSSSRVLNRVNSDNPTQIFGRLNANGSVYLMNPNGVYFQDGSMVNVGHLYAAAGHLSDTDFLAGKNNFTNLTADVVSSGEILGREGVHLFGAHVANFGSLVAKKGVVVLAAGSEVLVGQRDSHIFVRASSGPAKAASATGSPGVQNAGSIQAPRAIMGAGDMYAVAINNTGLIKSKQIALDGGQAGAVNVSGKLDASATGPQAKGGRITVTGQTVSLQGASLDASGSRGGGTVLVGGGFKGQGPIAPAQRTTVDAASVIKADALAQGAGGKVVVWSQEATNFQGTISAAGASQGKSGSAGSAAGGIAEISSKGSLGFNGATFLQGGDGSAGQLLLDPKDLVISSAVVKAGEIGPDSTVSFEETPDMMVITPDSLAAALLNATVTLQSQDDITFLNSVSGNAGGNLVLQAGRSIFFGKDTPITLALKGFLSATAFDNGAGTASAGVIEMHPASVIDTSGANGAITLSNLGGSLKLGTLNAGTAATGGVITLESKGAVSQTGGAFSGGGLLLSGPAGVSYNLNNNANSVGKIASNAQGAVSFTNNGNLAVDTVGGISGITNSTSSDIGLHAAGALAINQTLANGTGSILLVSEGDLTQAAAGVITTKTLGVRNNSPASGNIDLTVASNSFTAVAGYNARNAGNLLLRDAAAAELSIAKINGVSASGFTFAETSGLAITGAGKLALVAGGDLAINQNINAPSGMAFLVSNGNLIENGAVITASTLGLRNVNSSAGRIFLNGNNTIGSLAASNASSSNGSIIISSASAAQLAVASLDALSSGAVTLFPSTGGIRTAGNSTIELYNKGGISLAAPVDAGSGIVRLGGMGSISQTPLGPINAVTLRVSNSGLAGNIDLSTASNQIGAINAPGVVTISNSAADGSISLSSLSGFAVGQDLGGALFFSQSGVSTAAGLTHSNIIRLSTGGSLMLQQNVSAPSSGVSLISAQGIIGATGAVLAQDLAVTARSAVSLTGANTASTIAVQITGSGQGLVYVVPNGDLTAGSVFGVDGITTNDGVINLEASKGSLSLTQNITAGSGQVFLKAGNTIANSARISAKGLGLQAVSAAGFTSGMSVSTLAASLTGPGNTFYFTNSGALKTSTVGGLNGITTANADIGLQAGGPLTLDGIVNAGAGTVRLVANGDITETSMGGVAARVLGVRNVLASDGDISLNFNNQIGSLGVTGQFAAENLSAGGTIFFTNSSPLSGLNITSVDAPAAAVPGFTFGLTAGVRTVRGDIGLITTNSLNVLQNVFASGANVLLSAAQQVTQSTSGLVDSKGLAIISGLSPQLQNGNTFDTLAARITGAGQSFVYASPTALRVDNILGVTGISTNSAPITLGTVTGALTLASTVNSGGAAVRLFSEMDAVNETGAGAVQAASLSVQAAKSSQLAGANAVPILAADVSGPNQSFTFVNTGGLTIGTAGGLTGVSGHGAAEVNLQAGGSLAIGQPVSAGSGTVRLVSDGSITQTGDGAIVAPVVGVRNEGAQGDISLKLGAGTQTIAASNAAAGGSIVLDASNPDGLILGSVPESTSGGFAFTKTDGIKAAGNALVGIRSAGQISVNNVIDNGGGTVLLAANGGVAEGSDGKILANVLGVQNGPDAGGVILLANGLNQIGTLSVFNAANGSITIVNAPDLAIGSIGTTVLSPSFTFAGISGVQSSGGNIGISSAGTLALGNTVSSSGGQIRLESGKALMSSAPVNSSGGNIGIKSGEVLTLSGPVNAGAGTVFLSAKGGIAQNDPSIIQAGALGVQNIDAGDVVLAQNNQIGTLAVKNSALGGSITVKGNSTDPLTVGEVAAVPALGFNDPITGVASTAGAISDANFIRLTNSGGILLASNVTAPGASISFNSTSGTLQETTGRAMGDGLALRVFDAPVFAESGNDFKNLAALVSKAGEAFVYSQANGLTIGSVDGIDGIKTADGLIRLTSSNSDLVLEENVNSGTNDTVLSTTLGTVTEAGGAVMAGGLALLAQNAPKLDDSKNQVSRLAAHITGTGQNFTFTQDGSFTVGAVRETLGITVDDGKVMLASKKGNLSLAEDVKATGREVRLSASSGRIGGGGGVIALTLITTTQSGLRLLGPNEVSRFTGRNLGTGDISFHNIGDLAIGGEASGEELTTQAGNISVDAIGNLTVLRGVVNESGSVSLKASGSITQSGLITSSALSTNSGTGTTLDLLNLVDSFEAASLAGDILFVNAKNNLQITGANAQNGNITIRSGGDLLTSGPISADGFIQLAAQGSETINGSLASTGNGAITLAPAGSGSNVTVRGTVSTGGAFTAEPLGNASFSGAVKAGSIRISGQNVGVNNLAATFGDLYLRAVDGLFLNGTSYSGRNVLLNADPLYPRQASPKASIIVTNAGLVAINAENSYAVGYLQNLLAYGSLTINASTATLGDTAARGALVVSANQITLLDREPNGGTLGGRIDRGLNFVANTIDFGGASLAYSGQGNGKVFFAVASGAANVERISGATFFVDSQIDNQFQLAVTGADGVFPSATALPFQLLTGGSVDANVIAALAGALPRPRTLQGAAEARFSAATVAKLLSLGVSARDPDEDEKKGLKARRALFKQLSAKSMASNSDYQVVVNRIAPGQVELVLNTYDRIFGAKQELKPNIEKLFTEQYGMYVEKTSAEDASGFGAYLVANQAKDPQARNALAVIGQFRELFTQLGKIGLTAKEVEISQDVVARSLEIEGLTPADFLNLVGTPKNQAPPPLPVLPAQPVQAGNGGSPVTPS